MSGFDFERQALIDAIVDWYVAQALARARMAAETSKRVRCFYG